MKLSRVYCEITNICNLNCSFCPGTARAPEFMSTETFSLFAEKIRSVTSYLYLHVMGEPLMHPYFSDILDICQKLDFKVTITTNGVLLPSCERTLLSSKCLYKVNVSLHSFEANRSGAFIPYLSGCADFAERASSLGILTNLRLWNLNGSHTLGENSLNDQILCYLKERFPEKWEKNNNGWKLCDKLYIHEDEKFDWPDMDAPDYGSIGTCKALEAQCAVLCDGTVVPCCLDRNGEIALGNLFTQSLKDILSSKTSVMLLEGFRNRQHLHPLCRHCGYSTRFIR